MGTGALAIAPVWRGCDVFLTGHTGFKGGWLTLWLHALGARVHGYALEPPTTPSLFEAAGLQRLLASECRADLADRAALAAALAQAAPRVVFHLAAQPLVRASYADPLGTLASNVMGTAHLLEAVRGVDSVEAVVVVTTDKVYLNREWVHPYRESDALGGHDPYSASKAAAEMVAASYRASFFATPAARARIATARAGNVIGGGDWAADRLVPDGLQAFAAGQPLRLRYPEAVRPWQHVLEPLAGYLLLAQELLAPGRRDAAARAWNFGPGEGGDATVGMVAQRLAQAWGADARVEITAVAGQLHEAGLLRLDAAQARSALGWRPRWDLDQAIEATVAWHRAWQQGADLQALGRAQIAAYTGAGGLP